MITTSGKDHVADQMADQAQGDMTYMAIGTGTTAAAAGDTALETENFRKALESRTRSGNVVTYVGSFGNGEGSGAITELGIFNASSAGVMLNRIVFAAKNKGASDVLEFTVQITYGS